MTNDVVPVGELGLGFGLVTSSNPAQSFGYGEFGAWYDAYRVDTLEPALAFARARLDGRLEDSLSDRDLARIRNIAGRVKSKRRTWRKLRQPRYSQQISTVDDIPLVIDDLVGLRITCTNLRDLEMVQAALDGLPIHPLPRQPLGLDPGSERDYVEAPKDSGYRGWHVNLRVAHNGTPVTCELQIRTLLQDSWGELTHEDTYSKAGELPPLVEILSSRMADLLATLDDIAEDLRNELDRIDEAVVAASADLADGSEESTPHQDVSGLEADAAEVLLDRWRALDRPLELASLAWALQKEFGAEVSDHWFGHRSFKHFLRQAVPDGEISTGRQAYLLPAEDSSSPATDVDRSPGNSTEGNGAAVGGAAGGPRQNGSDDAGEDASGESDAVVRAPREARQLRRIDRGFPIIETEQWVRIYAELAESWRRVGHGVPGTRMVNQLTRSARDRAAASGEPLSRRHLDYVAKALMGASDAGEPLDASQVGDVFVTTTLQRMADLRILSENNAKRRAVVARWLLSEPRRD